MTGRPEAARLERDGGVAGPAGYDILILDASMKQSLASVRSLGKGGLRVAAGESVAQFAPGMPLPTFQSRFCLRQVVLPDLVSDEPGFVAAVTGFGRDYAVRVVLPTGDVTIGVLRKYRARFAELGCFLALSPEPALEVANDKDLTLTLAEQLGIAQPKSLRI